MENNKNKRSVKFQGDMLNFCDFIQVFVFTKNHHLKALLFRLLYFIYIILQYDCQTFYALQTTRSDHPKAIRLVCRHSIFFFLVIPQLMSWAQLFKTNDVVS